MVCGGNDNGLKVKFLKKKMDPGGQGELIGAIKIKDGLFIGDEMAAQVGRAGSEPGPRVRLGQQGHSHHQLRWSPGAQPLGADRSALPDLLLARPGQSGTLATHTDYP